MNIEDFRNSSSYKETVKKNQLTDVEKNLKKKRAELLSLYKRLDKLNEQRRELEGKKNSIIEDIFSLVNEQKQLTQ